MKRIPTQNDIAKLPQWAQMLIGKLQRDLEDARAQLGQAASDDPAVSWSSVYNEVHGLPDTAVVTFRVAGGSISVKRLHDGALDIRANYFGRYVFSITPRASNSAGIKLLKG